MSSRCRWVLASFVVLLACGGETPSETDAGRVETMDAGRPVDCASAEDGTSCGAGQICLDGVCNESTCGDGFTDANGGEECDDGNAVAFDGCEPGTCLLTCSSDAECDDGSFCNGTETCSSARCALGEPPSSGTPCPREGMEDGVCRGSGTAAMCVNPGCGNGAVESGEQCDDMNDAGGDGCEPDCTFTCETDLDCTDNDVCTGMERCNTANHRCEASPALECDDANACTTDACDPALGCSNVLVDMDMDGHAPSELGECGDDCDDDDPTTYSGATELCEASPNPDVDNDCNPSTPNPAASLWFLDCDEDSYSIVGAPSMLSCEEPAPQSGCGWTSRVPVSGDATTVDCNDANANMRPNQTQYFTTQHSSGANDNERFGDYNCNATAEYNRTRLTVSSTATCAEIQLRSRRVACSGTDGWVTDTTPGCGFSGMFSDCSGPEICRDLPLICARRGCSLLCEADESTCTRTEGCVPGSRDCPWAYYCCQRVNTTDQLGCR